MSPKYDPFIPATQKQSISTDTAIAHRALERLRASSFVSVRRLTCDVHEGMLTLRGRLPSFYTKQIALSVLVDVEGVEEITDRVIVS
ncbi:MAG TPA: BON domain-containing protein [Pirellulales bacterium]|nr:BON domain-containing protein [Pirellulales bacterium]